MRIKKLLRWYLFEHVDSWDFKINWTLKYLSDPTKYPRYISIINALYYHYHKSNNPKQ